MYNVAEMVVGSHIIGSPGDISLEVISRMNRWFKCFLLVLLLTGCCRWSAGSVVVLPACWSLGATVPCNVAVICVLPIASAF